MTAPTIVTIRVRCDVSAAVAWTYLSDYRNIPRYFDGVADYTPVNGPGNCPDARYDVTAKIGPSKFRVRVATIEWDPERAATYESTKVLKTVTGYRYHAIDDHSCDVELRLEVGAPGPLGKVLAPFIRSQLAKTATNIAEQLAQLSV